MCAKSESKQILINKILGAGHESEEEADDEISMEDEQHVLQNRFFAILDAKETEDGEYMIKIKNTLGQFQWKGDSAENSKLWGDDFLELKTHKNNIVKLQSSMGEEEPRSALTHRNLDTEARNQPEVGVWIPFKTFCDEFSYITVCAADNYQSGKST